MSIGPNSPLGYSLPASIVGGVMRNLNETAQARAEQAQQSAESVFEKLAARETEDVMETGLSADRDVDGRLPYDLPPEEQEKETEEEAGADGETKGGAGTHRSIDADGEIGARLDLDA